MYCGLQEGDWAEKRMFGIFSHFRAIRSVTCHHIWTEKRTALSVTPMNLIRI